MFVYSFVVQCGARPCPDVRLLVIDVPTIFPSSGIGEHLCCWYVSSRRTALLRRTNNLYSHHQLLGSFPTYPLELNELDLSGFTAWALWYVHAT